MDRSSETNDYLMSVDGKQVKRDEMIIIGRRAGWSSLQVCVRGDRKLSPPPLTGWVMADMFHNLGKPQLCQL